MSEMFWDWWRAHKFEFVWDCCFSACLLALFLLWWLISHQGKK